MPDKFGHVSVEEYPTVVEKFAEEVHESEKFIGKQCTECGKKYFPPVSACEEFHSADKLVDYEVPTDATLAAFTVIHFAPDNMADKAPYVVAIGELEPGIRVMAHLVGVTSMPKVGMKMKLKPQRLGADRSVYKFTPA